MDQNTMLTDRDIAVDMLSNSKGVVTSLSKTLAETTNPQLRETLRIQLGSALTAHYKLSDMMTSKGWYNAYADPNQQLQNELTTVRNIVQ